MKSAQRNKILFAVVLYICTLLITTSSFATIGAYEFETEQERSRFQLLVQELRCPKCQNQNLLDSNSEIAVDLRDQVARMVREGMNDEQIKEYMVNRYGDFVLYRPPMQSNTLVLWWAPLIMSLIGGCVFLIILLRRRKLAIPDLEQTIDQTAAIAGEEDKNP